MAVCREKPGLFLVFVTSFSAIDTFSYYCVPGSGDVNTAEVLLPSHLLTMTFQGWQPLCWIRVLWVVVWSLIN